MKSWEAWKLEELKVFYEWWSCSLIGETLAYTETALDSRLQPPTWFIILYNIIYHAMM